jgi:hypothetical protein
VISLVGRDRREKRILDARCASQSNFVRSSQDKKVKLFGVKLSSRGPLETFIKEPVKAVRTTR